MEWPLLEGLPEEDIRELLSIARRRMFSRGEVVFHRDDPADSLHLIARGRFAARLQAPLGDSVLLDVLGPGQSFGELALLLPGHASLRHGLRARGRRDPVRLPGRLRPPPAAASGRQGCPADAPRGSASSIQRPDRRGSLRRCRDAGAAASLRARRDIRSRRRPAHAGGPCGDRRYLARDREPCAP